MQKKLFFSLFLILTNFRGIRGQCAAADLDVYGFPQFFGGNSAECGIFSMTTYFPPGFAIPTILLCGYCDNGGATNFGFCGFTNYEFSNFSFLFKFDDYSHAIACEQQF